MTPKRLLLVFAAVVASVSVCTADVLTWTGGGDGLRWSDSDNWTSSGGHALPATGDSVEIDIGSTATTMENDLSGISLAKVTAVGQNDIVLTITGNPIGLAGQTDANIHVWTNSCSIQLDAGTSLTGGSGSMYFGGQTNLVNGNLFAGSDCTLKIWGRPYHRSSVLQPGLSSNEPYTRFNGDIGGDGCTLYIRPGFNGSATTAHYHGNIICANLYLAPDNCQHIAYFNKSGNRIGAIRHSGYRAHFNTSEAFTADTVINLDEDCGAVNDTYAALRFLADSYQVLNRLEGGNPADNPSKFSYQRIFAGGSGKYASPATATCTLELKGTANAVTYACLCDAVNVIWNPTGNYTQDFRDIRHVTSGRMTVKGGTVRTSGTNSFVNLQYLMVAPGANLEVASTNVTAFPAVQTASFGAGAKLRITEAEAVPFTAEKTLLSLGTGAKIEMATGATVNVGRLYVSGNEIAAGTYTTADWLEGAGTVNVAGTISGSGSSLFRWISPVGGAWNTPTSWLTGSVPGASDTAYLDSLGNDYTVIFDGATDTMPKNVNMTGGGGEVTLSFANESYFHSRNITLKDGARMLIPSGAVFTRTNTMVVTVHKDSEVCVTGTGRLQVTGFDNSGDPVRLRGGRLVFRDSAALDTAAEAIGFVHMYHNFNEGETIFADSSRFTIHTQNDGIRVKPSQDGSNALLVFKDSAGIVSSPSGVFIDPLTVGDGKRSGRVEFVSNFAHSKIYTCKVGSPSGEGTMLVGAGYVNVDPRGLWVGGAGANQWSKPATSGGVGHLVVTGGVLRIGAASVSEGSFPGLTLGEAAWIAASIVNSYTPWTGHFIQSGGIVTNYSNTCVGGQRGTGTFLQTGGEFYGSQSSASYVFCAGIRGGRGDVDFNGGKAEIKGDVYAGGIFTNAIPRSTTSTAQLLPEYGWSNLVHYGTGRIRVAGGNVQFKRDLLMGFDGTGIVERAGSAGSFTITRNVMMSNTVEFASASVLRFILDENGIDPIRVGGTVETVPGSRIEVDISGYAGRRAKHTLLTAGAITGSFDDIEITGGGMRAAASAVLVDSTSISLVVPAGSQILIR